MGEKKIPSSRAAAQMGDGFDENVLSREHGIGHLVDEGMKIGNWDHES